MRITDPEIIKTGEMDLINSVKDDLDWDVVKSIIKNRLKMKSLDSKGGEIVVVDGKIAFRIDLELKMSVSLMFDRDGNYIEAEDASDNINTSDKIDSLQKTDQSDGKTKPDQETKSGKHDLEFGLPDFTPGVDDKKSGAIDDNPDIGHADQDTPVSDISDEINMDSDSDFDLEFEDALDNLGLEDTSHAEPDSGFDKKIRPDRKNDAFDNDIDDDIDDILEETRELWKQKRE